ncbi:MAG TPA: ATP-binding protein, partial [Polyangia bacterium]|nr:ATP-binding protein [Polyangia bacterium]
MITLRSASLVAAMVAAVAAVAVVASWDADREAARALGDFAAEQATFARALGAVVRVSAGGEARQVLDELNAVPRPSDTVVLVRRIGAAHFLGSDGREVDAGPVADAFARGETVARLSRPEAAQLGLPTRTAWAGLARIDVRGSGGWEIAAIASAQRQRDRERAASRRLVGSVSVAAVLVLAFGGFAMRQQRKELLLERELAVASLQERGDERLQRASRMAALGTLAIGVAHEIATPLGVIAGRAEQLLPRADDERTQRGLQAILDQVKRIDEVIRGLLGLARGVAPAGDQVAPRGVVAAAVALVEHRFKKTGVPLRCEVAPALPAINGDARLIEHALVNLLLNACDACRGGGEVVVRAGARHEPPRRQVVFTVADTGAGISEADLSRVVEPLFTTKPVGEGTGLGLAIAREIVSSHRGELALGPGPAGGTVVTVWLPAAAEAAAG